MLFCVSYFLFDVNIKNKYLITVSHDDATMFTYTSWTVVHSRLFSSFAASEHGKYQGH
jgi:hypothetical protein